ncbi:MAG: hypothetical protein WCP93_03420 [Candidatus Berkelbacteria bacterium]
MNELNQQVSGAFQSTQIKKKKNFLPLIIGVLVLVLLAVGIFFLIKTLAKPKFEIISPINSQQIVVYLPKDKVNQKTINQIVAQVKKDVDAANAKRSDGKGVVVFYNLRVIDDKAIAQLLANPGQNMQQLSQLKPEEFKAQMDQRQKDIYTHMVFMSTNASNWKIVYGQNYRSYEIKTVPNKTTKK